MALELKISVTTGSGNFLFSETTGAYNVSTNPTGWGAPNEQLAWATTDNIQVYKPDSVTLLPGTTPVTLSNPAGLPTATIPNSLTISPQQIGYATGESLPDGIYQFVYTVDVNNPVSGKITYTITQYVLIYAGVQCCAGKLAVKAASSGCGCSGGCGGCGDDASNFEKVMLMIEAAKYSIQCGSITSAAKAIVHAQEICNGCQSCC
jgi:hypothetical protein